jgi:hypothetical protein
MDGMEGAGMTEDERKCKCGEPHDNWPGNDGGLLCQMCWESECDKSWWEMVIAFDKAINGGLKAEGGRE